jgi:hypothetical protein
VSYDNPPEQAVGFMKGLIAWLILIGVVLAILSLTGVL